MPADDMLKLAEQFACPNCDGSGEVRGPEIGMPYYPCRFCDGEGTVSADKADDWYFAAQPGDWS